MGSHPQGTGGRPDALPPSLLPARELPVIPAEVRDDAPVRSWASVQPAATRRSSGRGPRDCHGMGPDHPGGGDRGRALSSRRSGGVRRGLLTGA